MAINIVRLTPSVYFINILWAAFSHKNCYALLSTLAVCFRIFCRKKIIEKAGQKTRKMLVKLAIAIHWENITLPIAHAKGMQKLHLGSVFMSPIL